MVFISHAQFGEDVVLWRALGDREKVTYVDVGGFHPTHDSVTRALYERGWRGVNIEAQADRIAAFEEERPEDTNLAIAVGDHDGTATLTLPNNPGWATIRGTDALADMEPQLIEVPMRSLGTLLPELGLDEVDVLKIDVEGAEADVVRGLLTGSVRPTVCVVEGVSPGFDRDAGDEAVALLVEAGYTHCMFDGLNHYLTTDPSLVTALSTPANPLDDFMTATMAMLLEEHEQRKGTLAGDHGHTGRRRETFLRLLAGAGPSDPGAGSGNLDPVVLHHCSATDAITTLFVAVLGREPDPSGLAAWSRRRASGVPVHTIAAELFETDEAQARPAEDRAKVEVLIRRLQAFHNVTELAGAGPAGRTYTSGRVAAEVFVESLYTVGLDRAPSDQELEEAAAALSGGTSRAEVLAGFAERADVRDRSPQRRSSLRSSLGNALRSSVGGGRDASDLALLVAEEEVRRVAALGVTFAEAPGPDGEA